MANELATIDPKELHRISTDVAGLCKDAVLKTSIRVGGKNYVKVEGWQTIGAAHGCLAEIESVQEGEIEGVGGLICWSKLKRISDGAILSRASAFLGEDESQDGVIGKKYARYAKVQTRAISRVLSNAFRFVVVLMNAGLETTPAEEIPRNGLRKEAKGEEQIKAQDEAQDEVQEIEGELKEVYDLEDWTGGTVKGITFSTKRPELAAAIKAGAGLMVRVVLKKVVIGGGKVRFRPRSIEILEQPHTESESE